MKATNKLHINTAAYMNQGFDAFPEKFLQKQFDSKYLKDISSIKSITEANVTSTATFKVTSQVSHFTFYKGIIIMIVCRKLQIRIIIIFNQALIYYFRK